MHFASPCGLRMLVPYTICHMTTWEALASRRASSRMHPLVVWTLQLIPFGSSRIRLFSLAIVALIRAAQSNDAHIPYTRSDRVFTSLKRSLRVNQSLKLASEVA